MSWAPFVTAIPEMVSIASPVGTPPAQIGPSAVALPFSRVTPYVPDPSSKTPPVSSAVVIVYTTRTLYESWTKMPRPASFFNLFLAVPVGWVHGLPEVSYHHRRRTTEKHTP